MKILEYKRLNIIFLEKINKLKDLIYLHYLLIVFDYQKRYLIMYTFVFLTFRLLLSMQLNLDFGLNFTIFNLLCIEFAFDFFFDESLLNEDFYILNAGESSSQGPYGQNPNNGGEGSSQGPSGQNPNPNNAGNPAPHNF